METHKGVSAITAMDRNYWRNWLQNNHDRENSVWLIIYKKDSGINSINTEDAIDEALCFGWIDSLPNKRDYRSFYLFFSKRNPKSNWSRVNKEKAQKLINAGFMHPAGQKMMDIAKATGTWDALNDVENLVIPIDLMELFEKNSKAWQNWLSFPPSARRGILEWIFNAKTVDTRQKRLSATVEKAAENKKANFPGN